ncbi:MAG: inositol-3-phosphate synthase [Candidatus Odinarchaeum yellowstonii]|uniref:Inositol-3-phosphate synthase n=1 Tax=Odinarchaeota yellowstonii (strain LCB_4) TaxID=1841599 RepID=A0AAF0IBU7_ODILC|nr:MAG: inositol-3-phosphate synthase [Candidatus Odinarchaeum yellowstonii]
MGKIKVAVAGLGNCASALIQGIEFYKNIKGSEKIVPGLMNPSIGGYLPKDIEIVAAFDVNRNKIGKDISEAIFIDNCVVKFADVPKKGVKVVPGPILDGVAPHMVKSFNCYDEKEMKPVDVAEHLKEADAEILINYLPVGSAQASRFYAKAALEAGCGFINAIPEFIASDKGLGDEFEKKKLPIAGDDVKSQLGATILHRAIVDLCVNRGVQILETYQLNVGGDTDFENMTVEERLKTKRISKTTAVTSIPPYEIPTRIGPSDYIPFLKNRKICYIWLKGLLWGQVPATIDVKLSVEDAPDSAGVVVDVIRCMKLALDRGIGGRLISISAYSFKHPPVFLPDSVAKTWVQEFIEGKRER